MSFIKKIGNSLIVAFMIGNVMASFAQAETNVLFIVDASGSMKKKVEGDTRMDVAKKVLGETLGSISKDTRLGLLAYGHRKAKDCTDIELLSPIGGEDANSIGSMVKSLKAKGETPIAESLLKASKSFNAFKDQDNKIILVTDGLEECGGDPCAAAKQLKDSGLDIAVNIVGFTLDEKDATQLKCVTDTTGGNYYSASNAQGLNDALKTVVKKKKPEPVKDILGVQQGGTLLVAPHDNWNQLHDGDPKTAGNGGEGVFAFKDGKAASIEAVEVLIPAVGKYNLREFEVFLGDEGLGGTFRSVGKFTVHNAKVMPEGWQRFEIPKQKAKFIKFALNSDHGGGYVILHELRVIGEIDEDSVASDAKNEVQGEDLLEQSKGGMLLVSPQELWSKLHDGDTNSAANGGEGVFAFKDERTATVEAVEVFIPSAGKYNLREFEVFLGDEGPTGTFRSVGTFTAQNAKAMPDGWQRFIIPKQKAKYIKFALKSDYGGGYIIAYELRALGTLE